MTTSSLIKCNIIVTVTIFCGLIRWSDGQINTAPPCQVQLADQCTSAALQATTATGCNWYLIVPALSSCINNALIGCTYAELQVYQQLVADYNITLQLDSCNPACTNQTARESLVFQCMTYSNGQIEDLISYILSQTTPPASQCATLSSMESCLLNATAGCPALVDYAYDRINAANGSVALTFCSLPTFQPAPTIAPLNIFNTGPFTLPSSSTTAATAASIDPGQLALVIIGSIVILATIIVIIILIVLTCQNRRRRERRDTKSLLSDMWRPFGQKAYARPVNQDQVTILRPAQQTFRPVNYQTNGGFFTEATQPRFDYS